MFGITPGIVSSTMTEATTFRQLDWDIRNAEDAKRFGPVTKDRMEGAVKLHELLMARHEAEQ